MSARHVGGVLVLLLALSFAFAPVAIQIGFWATVGVVVASTVVVGLIFLGLFLLIGPMS